MIQKFAELTEQELLDKVANHLLTQYEQCLNSKRCAYRSADGLKCAAGCLIEDDEYLQSYEDKSWQQLCRLGYAKKDHRDLIDRLQRIHDFFNPEEWRDQLRNVAAELKLEFLTREFERLIDENLHVVKRT